MNQTKLDRFQLVRFGFKPNQTRSDIFWFGLSVSLVLSEPHTPLATIDSFISTCGHNVGQSVIYERTKHIKSVVEKEVYY